MALRLKNRRILITRPEAQAKDLKTLIENEGGAVAVLSTIAIDPVDHDIGPLLHSPPELIIFTSRNAVDHVDQQLFGSIQDKRILAIGKATADSIMQRIASKVEYPYTGTGSEALLELDSLQRASVKQKHIAIVKGEGGRTLIDETLQSRGARVINLDVYKRSMPEISMDIIQNIWQKKPPDVIVITSGEGLENLFDMLPDSFNAQLMHTQIVVLSDRIAQLASTHGFIKDPVVSKRSDDVSVVEAIVSTCEDGSHD